MNAKEALELGLTNTAFHLATAIDADGHCEPASRIVRDGSHKGTMFSWINGDWIVVDLENRKYLGTVKRLAVVTLDASDDQDRADNGLNQKSLGCDLDTEGGEWVVDADELDNLRESYGDELIVLWEQD